MSSPVYLITGASRGLGKNFVAEAVKRGFRVAISARKLSDAEAVAYSLNVSSELVIPIKIDVTSEQEARGGIEKVIEKFGRIDGLINNAGYGLLGAIEEVSAGELETLFLTNVVGAHRMMRLILPVMRKQKSGIVINISSLGGFASSPGWGAYNASKFALEGLSEALAIEVAPHSIRVMIVEPGSFRTGFLSRESKQSTAQVLDSYGDTVVQMRKRVEQINGAQAGDPTLAAKVVFDAAVSDNPPQRLVLGKDAIDRVETKLKRVSEDLQAWRDKTSDMGFA